MSRHVRAMGSGGAVVGVEMVTSATIGARGGHVVDRRLL